MEGGSTEWSEGGLGGVRGTEWSKGDWVERGRLGGVRVTE